MNYNDHQDSDVFDIVRQTKYGIEIARVAIEDAGDEFLTEDELDEMDLSMWGAHLQIRPSAITKAIEGWVAKIPEGKKSVKCTDGELIEALVDCHYPISHFVDGLRRVGDRISIHKPAEKDRVIKIGDVNCLLYTISGLLESSIVRVAPNGGFIEKLEAFPLLKKLASWEEIEQWNDTDINSHCVIDDEVMPLLKVIWEDDKKREEFMDSKRK